MDENKKELSKIWFPEGTKIKLNHMNDQTKPVPEGTIGTVKFVDDEGTIHMQWENGSSLALILGEDDFEVVEENTMEKPFSRTILYYKNFAFGNNDQVYESSIKELKKEIETRWFYHAEANINSKDEESYKNFIDWTRMVIQIHDMDDEEFVDKILKRHSNYPPIEDVGFRFINDSCDVFKSEVLNHLLYEAQKITCPEENMNVLGMIIEKCSDLIDMSNEQFFKTYDKLNNENKELNIKNYTNAILKDVKENASYNKYTIVQGYDNKTNIEFWNDYNERVEELDVNHFRAKLINDYLQFAENNIGSNMDEEEKKSFKGWIKCSLDFLKMPYQKFAESIEQNKYDNEFLVFKKFHDKNSVLKTLKLTSIDGTAYLTTKMLGDVTNQEDEIKHNNEIEHFQIFLNKYVPDYKCYIFPHYADVGHKNRIMDVYNDNLHNTLENIFETADIHSGIDLKFNELGDLVLRCYGNMYHYVPDNVTLETITDYHIVPVDNNNEKINLYEEIFGNDEQELQQSQKENDYELEQ